MTNDRPTDRLLRSLYVTRRPVLRAYDGFGDGNRVVVHGHALALSPNARVTYRNSWVVNLFSLVRLYAVIPFRKARVTLQWNGEVLERFTDRAGFFEFDWVPATPPPRGWSTATVALSRAGAVSSPVAMGQCDILVPGGETYSVVSDIDDTFLISHSSGLFRRLYVLLTKNARSRMPFDGVVEHYRCLSRGVTGVEGHNPFFYVSGSEWNLYDYIREFCRKQGLPRGVFLLSKLKTLSEMLQTGQGYRTKYMRIARLLTAFPACPYVLLGDNSQEDPAIYAAIARDFPGRVLAVYIRNIRPRRRMRTLALLADAMNSGVPVLVFDHSSEAIAHSRRHGLIL